MLLALAAPAAACDVAVLDAVDAPAPTGSAPVVASARARLGDLDLVGVAVAMRSGWDVGAWEAVLSRPEDDDTWHPEAFGTHRVERLDASHLFQQIDVHAPFGPVHVRQQIVVRIDWLERSATRLRNCWIAADPAPFAATLRAWAWSGVEMRRTGLGGWDVRAHPDGGTLVRYEAWADPRLVPAAAQARAMATKLPDLLRAYEARVGEVAEGR